MTVRRADFAGSWYPGSGSDCRQAIEELDQSALPCPSSSGEKVGGIVPHAGWYYSGRIACSVIKCLQNAGRCIRSETDKGIIIFLDQRYAWPYYIKYFPQNLDLKITLNAKEEIEKFYSLHKK